MSYRGWDDMEKLPGQLCDLSEFKDSDIGVVPIYLPAGRARGRIFAFHSPGGSWKTTWCHPPSNASPITPHTFWLRDFLPQKFPQCGIYSIGWISRGNNHDPGYDVAKYIEKFLHETIFDHRAPLVFIAPSSSGSVLDDAIETLWVHDKNSFSGEKSEGSLGRFRSWTPALDQMSGIVCLAESQEDIQGVEKKFQSFAQRCPIRLKCLLPRDGVDPAAHQASGMASNRVTVNQAHAAYSWLEKFKGASTRPFHDVCQGISDILGASLTKDPSWHATVCPAAPQRPFDTRYAVYDEDNGFSPGNTAVLPSIPWKDKMETGSWTSWIHFPTNNIRLMADAMDAVSPVGHTIRETTSKSLGSVIKARNNVPHSRYVLPKLEMQQVLAWESMFDEDQLYDERLSEARIFLPYLHWDTCHRFRLYSEAIWKKYSQKESSSPSECLLTELNFPDEYFEQYHPRRSLDQFYYTRTADTRRRDADQVVSRQTSPLLEENLPGGPRMIMVDQLWLCIYFTEHREARNYARYDVKESDLTAVKDRESTAVKNRENTGVVRPDGIDVRKPPEVDEFGWKYTSSAVTSCFPATSYVRSADDPPDLFRTVDIRQKVVEWLAGRRNQVRATDMAAFILESALLGCLSVDDDWSLKVLDLFRDAITNVSEQHDEFFRKLDKSMKRSEERISIDDRRKELGQGLEIADILDELNMMRQLFETQRDIFKKGFTPLSYGKTVSFDWLRPIQRTIAKIERKIENEYLPQIERMEKDSRQLQRAILDVLDLQQKEESIAEAQRANQQALFTAKQALSAQDQADSTDAQSGILFAFAVVTIVFLPLSSLASYYGMFDIVGDRTTVQRSYMMKVVWGFSGTFIVASLILTVLWLFVGKRKNRRDRIDDLAKMSMQGDLPTGLLDKEMNAKVAEAKDRMVEIQTQAKLLFEHALPVDWVHKDKKTHKAILAERDRMVKERDEAKARESKIAGASVSKSAKAKSEAIPTSTGPLATGREKSTDMEGAGKSDRPTRTGDGFRFRNAKPGQVDNADLELGSNT